MTEFSVFGYNLYVVYFSEDILVFLTGQEEIESVVKSVRDISLDLPSGTYVIPQFDLAFPYIVKYVNCFFIYLKTILFLYDWDYYTVTTLILATLL